MSDLRGNVLQLVAGAVTVAAVVAGVVYSPIVAAAGVAAVAIFMFALVKGHGAYRGVAVLGAIIASVVIPPLHTGVPGWFGMAAGAAWLIVFGLLSAGGGSRRDWGTYSVFALLSVVGLASTALIEPFPYVGLVMLFLLAVGFFSRGLRSREWAIVRLGIVVVAVIEALLCVVEFIVFHGDPLDEKAGPHPVLAEFTRPEGTLGHPIVAGVAMLAGLSLVLASTRRFRFKPTVIVVLLGGIFATGSSSVYIAALVGVLLQTVLTGRSGWRVVKGAAVAAVGTYLIFHENFLAPLVDDVSGNNSTHRLNSIKAIPDLLTLRPVHEGLFGSGWGSEARNYQNGYIRNDYFFSVDNMFATSMMAAGVIGFALFCVLLLRAFARADARGRILIVTLAVMLFSFDVLQWASSGSLMLVVLLNTQRRRPDSLNEVLEGNAASLQPIAVAAGLLQPAHAAPGTNGSLPHRRTGGALPERPTGVHGSPVQ
ncbi:O-antigen ligase family protein [Curtobacterium sp. RHCJP20]|uniref:O-antigen ligase family protein n=1 Tax=Curtobacterium subtropicum TaxID=3055138 RepID=A0ABT7TCY6_9MICO|nr:O-antigen ligase family protein [Curtobacterium subtropicum]MDM7887440.1 O-antigen ligase family protein [Curtobacterium subtropicum]